MKNCTQKKLKYKHFLKDKIAKQRQKIMKTSKNKKKKTNPLP